MNGREDWFVYGGDYEETCPECGKAFTVEVNQTVEFDAQVPAEMERCERDCDFWCVYDFCGIGNYEEDVAPIWCPKGFYGKKDENEKN